jgi:hypothetical protein
VNFGVQATREIQFPFTIVMAPSPTASLKFWV